MRLPWVRTKLRIISNQYYFSNFLLKVRVFFGGLVVYTGVQSLIVNIVDWNHLMVINKCVIY